MKTRLNDVNDDLAFVRRVIGNEKEPVDYFLKVFSKPLLEYVGRCILKLQPVEVFNPDEHTFTAYSYSAGCISLYYKFIAEEFAAASNFTPQWDKLRYYESASRSRLATYLNVITTRYFYRHHPDTFDDTADEERRLSGRRHDGKSVDAELLSSYDESERLYLLLCLKLHGQQL